MKKIFIIALIAVALTKMANAQSGAFTTDTINGTTTISGDYWIFIYDNTKVLSPPAQIINGQTKTKKLVFATNTEQECYAQIMVLFGETEVNRVKAFGKPVIPQITAPGNISLPPPNIGQ